MLAASERQRSIARENFDEASAAESLRVSFLAEERALDSFLALGRTSDAERLFAAERHLTAGLAEAKRLSSDNAGELASLAVQTTAAARWRARAAAAVERATHGRLGDSDRDEAARGVLIDEFLKANTGYQDRLAHNREREEASAALLPIWVLLGSGGILGIAGALLYRRAARRQREARTYARARQRFVEAIQVCRQEQDAHLRLRDHLEHVIEGSVVYVLRRNNSADRLESALPLDESSANAPALPAEVTGCTSMNLGRRYDGDDRAELIGCTVCGRLGSGRRCQPLLVGGEVIGSVLVVREPALSDAEVDRLDDAVREAAPMLANLRNLARVETQALTDSLTGLANRRAADDTLRRMRAHAERAGSELAVLLLDLDHFKQINDSFGHERGDDVLAAFGVLIRESLRESDFAARTGGEEFAVYLPGTGRAGASTIAESLLAGCRNLRIAGVERPINVSIGIGTYPHDGGDTELLLRAADRALYRAKRDGRDRVVIADGTAQGATFTPA